MSCCGQKRTQVSQTTQRAEASQPSAETISQPQIDPRVYFQYVGKTALTIVGPISQKRYRFEHPGVVVEVDPKDKRAFAGVSVLTPVIKHLQT